MSFELKEEVKGSTLYVRVIGLLDYSTTDNFKVDIQDDIKKIVVDFSRLDFIDSTGIGSVLSIIYSASDRGLWVEFEGLNEYTMELFETLGVFRVKEALLKGEQ